RSSACAMTKDKFQDAFAGVWSGALEDDGFNRLVLRAGLDGREVATLRAIAKYLRQVRFTFSQETVESTLASHPDIARRLVRLFRVRHDPGLSDNRETRQREALDSLNEALDSVANLDEDRILRRFANVILASLRTNWFQQGPEGAPKPYISFKIDSHAVDEVPLPRPWREVFVYSPRVEAIHLRGGPVARGGIRWSDRREDFRTEILGLMKAQMVKNAVIVPVGSKGGFVVKHPPAGRDALLAEGIECYKTLMRGLLDITDNLSVDGSVIPPQGVVRWDTDDPYLVVAADKGTATFSDIANSVSLDYGFWLGDAFASGGSKGYDHKRMGITARGAWESVKRHFREMGHDTQTQDFTVVGVGDMSGDVFGNGMLLSKHIKLLAAFDHRHIFVDPDPDPAASWSERRRLFDLPRSSWADYDATLIAKGGGLFERSAKSIPISPEMKARFGIAADRLSPPELVQALLIADVDLLWFGGIGTYVKSSDETHADVGDKANDGLRVDASRLRCKVVGEGANLGMTQLGRIEAALGGVRLNTDAIDNSAGVDTSDHEVNIKILLNDVVARGDLTAKQRDDLLARMTDEVAQLVLADNYLQTQALTVAQAPGEAGLENCARFMRALEKAGRLNRAVERLPDDEDLARRAHLRLGLTRPELAVLLAYAKITLYADLLASDLPDDPKMAEDLIRYFPEPLRRDFRDPILRHRLRREIIGTVAANGIVNRVGPTFVKEMIEKTGRGPGDIARAYMVVRDAFDLRALWRGIQDLDTVAPAEAQTTMLLDTIHLMERAVAWFLTYGPQPLDLTAESEAYRPGVEALAAHLDSVLEAEERERFEVRAVMLASQGVPDGLARRVAALPLLAAALDISRTAKLRNCPVPDVARIHFTLGQRFGLEWLRDKARGVKAENHWQKQAVTAILDDLYALQSQLAGRVLETGNGSVDGWLASRRVAVERVEQLLAELKTVAAVDLSMLAVANRQLRGLVAG
ncbi:MAG TPA: NAD-glutamate dehydrogenase domain-containing protein, partial [Azospirillaceae bacterium]|nr:NAD-glutamate dehydrogenase domain-containing protein [Azospirillaceae bacterium]